MEEDRDTDAVGPGIQTMSSCVVAARFVNSLAESDIGHRSHDPGIEAGFFAVGETMLGESCTMKWLRRSSSASHNAVSLLLRSPSTLINTG